jgi:hypothetical protein
MAFSAKACPLPLLARQPVQPGPRALSLSITSPGSHPGRWLVITCQPDSPRGNLRHDYIGTYPSEVAAQAGYGVVKDLHAAGAVGMPNDKPNDKHGAGTPDKAQVQGSTGPSPCPRPPSSGSRMFLYVIGLPPVIAVDIVAGLCQRGPGAGEGRSSAGGAHTAGEERAARTHDLARGPSAPQLATR